MGCSCGNPTESIFLSMSRELCRRCDELVDARYVSDGEAVYLERICPEHGASSVMVAESLAWYLDAVQRPAAATPPPRALFERSGPCPDSCGPCGFHAQACVRAVLPVSLHGDLEQLVAQVDFLVESTGGVDLLTLTGGDALLRDDLPQLLSSAARPEIGRVAVQTDAPTLASDPDLARRLADAGAEADLMFHTVDEARQALEPLEPAGVPTTLLLVSAGDNEDQLNAVLDLAQDCDLVRGLTIRTAAPAAPMDRVQRLLEEASRGRIRRQDFAPVPDAHPLCRSVNEQAAKPIQVHVPMDVETHEVGRAMRCPEQVVVPTGRLVGACNHTLFHRSEQ